MLKTKDRLNFANCFEKIVIFCLVFCVYKVVSGPMFEDKAG